MNSILINETDEKESNTSCFENLNCYCCAKLCCCQPCRYIYIFW